MPNSSEIRLKLLIDTQAKRVLFAEAGKDCVDFLFYILTLPVSKLVSLLRKDGMVGSLPNLYKSVENLNESYMQPNQTRDTLLKHVSAAAGSYNCVPLLAIEEDSALAHAPSKEKKLFYRCRCVRAYEPHRSRSYYYDNTSNGFTHISADPRAVCPNCGKCMDKLLDFVDYPADSTDDRQVLSSVSGGGGFVKGVVTYMVMDDLSVKPMSAISSITLLNEFDVNDVRALQEKVVHLGMKEAVELLKASLETKNVLTRVFMKDWGSSSIVSRDQHDKKEAAAVVCNKRQSPVLRPIQENGQSVRQYPVLRPIQESGQSETNLSNAEEELIANVNARRKSQRLAVRKVANTMKS